MAHRKFIDAHGVTWQVWSVVPTVGRGEWPHRTPDLGLSLPPEYHGGWLVFHSGAERRRLAPIPRAWEQLGVRRLAGLLARARVVPDAVDDRMSVSSAEPAPQPRIEILREATIATVPRRPPLVRFTRLLSAMLDDCGAIVTGAVRWLRNRGRRQSVTMLWLWRRRKRLKAHGNAQPVTTNQRQSQMNEAVR